MAQILALLIPITALMIPITAIVVHSPLGKAWARRIEQGSPGASPAELLALQTRVQALESQLHEQDLQVRQLQEHTDFYRKLLEAGPDAAA